MSHSRYLALIGVAGVFSWIGFIVVLLKLNPFESPGVSLALFFSTLFISLMCTFSIIGFYFRAWMNRNEIYYHHVNISLRQGIFLSLIVCISLALQLLGAMSWWSGILLVFIVILIEFYFLLKSPR